MAYLSYQTRLPDVLSSNNLLLQTATPPKRIQGHVLNKALPPKSLCLPPKYNRPRKRPKRATLDFLNKNIRSNLDK